MKKRHLAAEIKERAVKNYREGKSSADQIAKILGVTRETVHRWDREQKRRKTLTRRINTKAGRQPKINSENASKIIEMIKKPASEYGYETDFWTTLRMQQILRTHLNLKVSRMALSRVLKKLNQSYKKPEARYKTKNKDKKMEEWQEATIPEINRIIRQYKAILYFEDESNISLTPTVGKTWGTKGVKLLTETSPNRGSVSAISAITSSGFLVFNVHDKNKRFKAQDIIHFLAQILLHHKRRHVVVVMDRAPCHTSKKVTSFVAQQKRLHVFYLPPSSPELNPDEKVWEYLKNHALRDHKAKTTKELKHLTKRNLKKIAKNKRVLLGIYRRCSENAFLR
jgi:transposase